MPAADVIKLARYLLAGSLAAYLIGTFTAASFDIQTWHIMWRGIVAVVGPVAGIILFGLEER